MLASVAASAILRHALDQAGSLRALSQKLAADPRSKGKSAEVWRGQLQRWKNHGINLENARILADYLPGRPDPEELIDDERLTPHVEEALQTIGVAAQELTAALARLRPLLEAQSAVLDDLRAIAAELRQREAAN
jgi:hypothetical protein